MGPEANRELRSRWAIGSLNSNLRQTSAASLHVDALYRPVSVLAVTRHVSRPGHGTRSDAVTGSDLDPRHTGPDVRWRVTTPNGIEFTCRVFSNDARIEVRLTIEDDELLCARVVPSVEEAGTVARRWLRAVVAGETISEPSSSLAVVH